MFTKKKEESARKSESKILGSIKLFLTFFKLGFFTFGGGWSIIAQLQKNYVEDKKTITEEELLDLTSVARSLPGTMIGNVAMIFGYRTCGILGGIFSVIGMIFPPLIMLSAIALFYTAFRDNAWIAAAMNGVRASVVPIILSAAVGMVKSAFKFPPCVLVTLLTLGLYLFLDVNCVYLVIIGAVCGVIISEIYERKRGGEKS